MPFLALSATFALSAGIYGLYAPDHLTSGQAVLGAGAVGLSTIFFCSVGGAVGALIGSVIGKDDGLAGLAPMAICAMVVGGAGVIGGHVLGKEFVEGVFPSPQVIHLDKDAACDDKQITIEGKPYTLKFC